MKTRSKSAVGEMRHEAFAFEIDTRKTSVAEGTFGGYASVFNTLIPSYNEMVDPGAFQRTLASRGERVKVLWQHNPEDPIGLPTFMAEDGVGLKVEAQLADTPKIRGEYLPLMMPNTAGRAVVDRMSIGFRIMDDYINPDTGNWHLRDVELYEFSPVTFPANESAAITDARSTVRVLAERTMGLEASKPLSADEAKYAMAVLMGARGAGSFSDLDNRERRSLYDRLEAEYTRHGLEAPPYIDGPAMYSAVQFAHDEKAIFAVRSLQKRLSDVTSSAKHAIRLGAPIGSETLGEAIAALDAIRALGLDSVQDRMTEVALRERAQQRLGITLAE